MIKLYQIITMAVLSGCSIQTNPVTITMIDKGYPIKKDSPENKEVIKELVIKEQFEKTEPVKKIIKKTHCQPIVIPKIPNSPVITTNKLASIDKEDTRGLQKTLVDHIEELNNHIKLMKKKYDDAIKKQLSTCVVE